MRMDRPNFTGGASDSSDSVLLRTHELWNCVSVQKGLRPRMLLRQYLLKSWSELEGWETFKVSEIHPRCWFHLPRRCRQYVSSKLWYPPPRMCGIINYKITMWACLTQWHAAVPCLFFRDNPHKISELMEYWTVNLLNMWSNCKNYYLLSEYITA